ncbi:MAG: helix-turn-helix transcriptional regulator [Rudaea sp.]|uniref:helix-turn-helix domain-containing protein n=1 Tax=unclassified Rudaea TaxID=2627037 RepID=UPI0010FA36ED|nr:MULTISPECIES: helix-turn-helix transcriptional regulator [unclassified Rudaea]MBN8886820.1 helix-turn-helix transcriptional regulator [Rudaea sp.]
MKRTSIYSTEHAQLIDILREWRLEVGLSQSEVAKRLKRPQTYVSAIEVGRQSVTVFQLRDLCRVYGRTLAQFVAELEKRLETIDQRPRTVRPKRSDAGKAKRTPQTSRRADRS